MKKNLLRLSGTLVLIAACGFAHGQIVSGNAFLKSTYVEMGVNPYGVYISNVAPPAGYHSVGGLPYLGIIADADKDGWLTGSPIYCGDYFAPGSPEEGFAIQVGPTSYHNTFYGAPADAAGGIVGYNTSPGGVAAVWKGTIPMGGAVTGLQVTQTTTINTGKTMVITTVQLKNTSASTLNQVYYTRNADPDNEEEWSFDFTTNNIILKNHPTDAWAEVSATGLFYGCYFAMASEQSNAIASYGGFATSSVIPKDAWLGVSPFAITGSAIADVAIQMSFKVGNIAPGQTKVISFIYGTNEDDLAMVVGLTGDEVVGRMEAEINGVENVEFQPEFKVSPNPSHGDLNLYAYDMSSTSELNLQIVNLMGEVVYNSAIQNNNGILANTIQLDPSLANGTYYATLMVDGKPFTQAFVLSR